ncbi:MAG TPA: hypothetical protein VK870_04115 [Ignavibacteriaceae bacterium]|nr:hypothetical protein [Ignavibacteriaceae bacterium]
MIRIFLFVIISINFSYSQNFHSPENKKLFADYLFCSEDYLRAVIEYEEYIKHYKNDTVLFKIAFGYSKIENFKQAAELFKKICMQSDFYYRARSEYLKSLLLAENFESFTSIDTKEASITELKLINIAYLFSELKLPDKNTFLLTFSDSEKNEMLKFYEQKKEPPYKSSFLAGLLSSVVPGAGKIYTNQISEGLTSLVLNGLFAFLSYNNFKNDHTTRGWIFAGVGAFFYAGNIYGSAVSANIYNQRVDYEYKENVKLFLETHNYFIERYEFCK